MKTSMRQVIAFIVAGSLMLPLGGLAVGPAQASGPEQAIARLTIRVTEKGFFDERNKALGPSNPLRVPDGALVELTVVFDESIASLAIGDTHQIAVSTPDGWRIETGKIWAMNKRSVVTFRAGEQGRKRYRVYCILDCLGMEHLTNLAIDVVKAVDARA